MSQCIIFLAGPICSKEDIIALDGSVMNVKCIVALDDCMFGVGALSISFLPVLRE